MRRGSYLDASYRQLDRQIACRYRLCGDITIWPFELIGRRIFLVAGATAGAWLVGGQRGSGRACGSRSRIARRRGWKTKPTDTEALQANRKCCSRDAAPPTCRSISSARKRMRWRSTSSCSPIAGASISAALTSSAIRSFIRRRAQCLRQVGFEREDALFPNDHRVFEGFDLLREFFMFPRKFLGCNLTRPRRGAAAAQGENGRHPVRVRRGQYAARRRGAARRCLRFTPRRRSTCSRRPRIASRSNRASTNIMSCRTAAIISITSRIACLRSTPIIPAGGKRCRCSRSTPPRSMRREAVIRPILHGAPAAAAAHRRGKAPRRIVGLHRHRHVHLA